MKGLLEALSAARGMKEEPEEEENPHMKNPASMSDQGGDTIFIGKNVVRGDNPKEGDSICIYGKVVNTGSKIGVSIDYAEPHEEEEDEEEEPDMEQSDKSKPGSDTMREE